MPCRAAGLCRAQEQYLWITDDVLANAWNRFARVSHTNNTWTRGRRHGSNVPGPLEAHRRLSKRRMALATNTMGGMFPGFDLGALFGLAPFGSNRKMDEWKYEPPGLKEEHKTEFPWTSGLMAIGNKGWDSVFRMSKPLDIPESTVDRAAESRAAFENLLPTHTLPGVIQPIHLRAALDFLQSADDEPSAHNAERLAQWLILNTSSQAALQLFLDLVLEKARLQTVAQIETASILSYCLRHPGAGQALGTMSNILLVAKDITAICISVTRIIIDTVVDREHRILGPSALLDLWLRCLRQCDETGGCTTALPFHDIFTVLAESVQRPTILADHLSTLSEDNLAHVLLCHWVPQFVARSSRQQSGDGLASSDAADAIPLTRSDVFELVKKRYETFMKDPQHERQPLVALLAALNIEKRTRAPLAHEILEILLRGHRANIVYFHFRHFTAFKIRMSIDLTHRVIQLLLETNDLPRAWNVFKMHQAVSLSRCHDLPLRLVRSGVCTSALIWQILQRQTHEDTIPRAKRVVPRLSLLPSHIELIHQIAFAYAESPHLTPRRASRRVWECYLFLRDRRAPIGPLLSRAMVVASVSRYLREGRRVNPATFAYVLSVVARSEGEKVADALDKTVWRIWKEVVEPRARAARRSEDTETGRAVTAQTLEFRPTRRYRKQRGWLQFDEQHHTKVRQGDVPYVGAMFGQPRQDIVDAASVSYDRLMEEARALERTLTTEADAAKPESAEHIRPSDMSEVDGEAHVWRGVSKDSHLIYKPM